MISFSTCCSWVSFAYASKLKRQTNNIQLTDFIILYPIIQLTTHSFHSTPINRLFTFMYSFIPFCVKPCSFVTSTKRSHNWDNEMLVSEDWVIATDSSGTDWGWTWMSGVGCSFHVEILPDWIIYGLCYGIEMEWW